MKGYKCDECEHTASRKSSLAQHVSRVHEVKRDSAICKDGSDDENLEKEAKVKAEEPEEEVKGGERPSVDIRRKRSATDGVKKYGCEWCGFESLWRASLQEHVDSVHERKNVYRSELQRNFGNHKMYLSQKTLSDTRPNS